MYPPKLPEVNYLMIQMDYTELRKIDKNQLLNKIIILQFGCVKSATKQLNYTLLRVQIQIQIYPDTDAYIKHQFM